MTNMIPEELHPKPTDSEQLDFVYRKDDFTIPIIAIYNALSPLEKECFNAFLQERDQQRLAVALEVLPKVVYTLDEVKEFNKRLDSRQQQSMIDRSAEFIKTIHQVRTALAAALGPDNSKTKE